MVDAQTETSKADPMAVWVAGGVLAEAFEEQVACMRAVYAIAGDVVQTPAGAPSEYVVRLGEIPSPFYSVRKNIFSTLFYATYLALGIPRPRRHLYGALNHLFRIWVTSADNLLDGEDKCVLPLVMPGTSRIMREVVALLAADRVLWHLLDDAVAAGTLTTRQAGLLADESLRCLLPSAAQEASEESGIRSRPSPEQVIETIHVFKTGLLFNIPFMGVDLVEQDVDPDRLARLKRALRLFGGGCQILDDLRDIARDLVERRHNYMLSVLAQEPHAILARWAQRDIQVTDRLYFDVLPQSLAAAHLALGQIAEACVILRDEHVLVPDVSAKRMTSSLLTVLDLEDLADACAFA